MEFSSAHLNGLLRRLLSPNEMMERFESRSDFLHYRHVFFSQHGPPHKLTRVSSDLETLHVLKVVERFSRNKSKPANEDVAERVFLVPQRRFELTYHLMDHRFIPSKRSFTKPKRGHEFTRDLVTTFQVDLSEKPLKTLTLFRILNDLIEAEEDVASQILESLKEVRDIVACREKEEGEIKLWSPAAAAAQAWRERKNREIRAAEEEKTLQEQEKDVLAPFLIRLGNPETLNPDEAKQVYLSCLSEFKDREAEQIGLLQQRYDEETEELQAKQKWYQQSHQMLSQQQVEDYQNYCSHKTLKISVIQKRLNRLMAHDKYNALHQKLQKHPQLAAHLSS